MLSGGLPRLVPNADFVLGVTGWAWAVSLGLGMPNCHHCGCSVFSRVGALGRGERSVILKCGLKRLIRLDWNGSKMGC